MTCLRLLVYTLGRDFCGYLRPLNVVEYSSFNSNVRSCFACNVSDFGAYMFTFSVAIRPDVQEI